MVECSRMALTDDQLHTAKVLSGFFGTMSLIASCSTIYIIIVMKKQWSIYLLLIISLCSSEVIFDLGWLIALDSNIVPIANFLWWLGGLSAITWTVLINSIVYYIVTTHKVVDVKKYYIYFFLAAYTLPVILATYDIVNHYTNKAQDDDNVTAHRLFDVVRLLRVALILTNIVISFLLMVHIRVRSPIKEVMSLIKSLMYYPLVELVCRSGAAWYEYSTDTRNSYAALLMYSIFTASTGIGFFLVFLIMQKDVLTYVMNRKIPPIDDVSDVGDNYTNYTSDQETIISRLTNHDYNQNLNDSRGNDISSFHGSYNNSYSLGLSSSLNLPSYNSSVALSINNVSHHTNTFQRDTGMNPLLPETSSKGVLANGTNGNITAALARAISLGNHSTTSDQEDPDLLGGTPDSANNVFFSNSYSSNSTGDRI